MVDIAIFGAIWEGQPSNTLAFSHHVVQRPPTVQHSLQGLNKEHPAAASKQAPSARYRQLSERRPAGKWILRESS